MDMFIARQPIFDRDSKVYGYELLCRTGLKDYFDHSDPDHASSMVIADSLFLPRIEAISRGRLAFLPVTRDVLVQGWIGILPPEFTVAEIVEAVEPDDEVLKACRALKDRGYKLALDDFTSDSHWAPWVDLADILKVDVLSPTAPDLAALARCFLNRPQVLLAEKVETQETHRQAHDLGYGLFQGYFFARPTRVPSRDIAGARVHYLQLLREIHKPGLDFPSIEAIVEREVGLSYKLLRYLNSAFFGWRGTVASIRHALMLLGEREIRIWASIVVMSSMVSEKPDELVAQALLRGRFCELLAPAAGFADRSSDLFLLGTFSLIDAMLDFPLDAILREIPIAEDVKATLLGEPGPMRDVLEVVVAYDACNWEVVSAHASSLGLNESVIPEQYLAALHWCDQGFDLSADAHAA
jgi:EAL and modified HD-GYP domain-containing signal transduction protein